MASTRHRIGVGSLFIECNQLAGIKTHLSDFERCELLRGESIRKATGATAGMIKALEAGNAMLVPLMAATACPGGALTAECYEVLKKELLDRLRAALPLDGLLLALHGAATAENAGDLEGDLLQAVRSVTGPDLPIVATLDLHAHVTTDMLRTANALVAWETYPHRDACTTGQRATRLLLDILEHKCRPVMALKKVPILVGSVNASTEGTGPFAEIMRKAKALEGTGSVLSTSAFHVYPYAELPDMGSGVLVVTDDDPDTAQSLTEQLAAFYWSRRFDLEPEVHAPSEAIRLGKQVEGGPVLLVETADCCGGGAAGDSVAALKALLAEAGTETALVPVVDPEAAALCHQSGAGREIELDLGHKLDPQWGEPAKVRGTVRTLSEGEFKWSGGIWRGQTGHMGPSAVLRVRNIHVLIMTHPTYDWADEQFVSMNLNPSTAKFVVVKNPMNFRVGYQDIAKAAYILDTPGPTPAIIRGRSKE